MKEKDITPKILKWCRDHIGTCAVEVKYCKGGTLPKDALKEHQYTALKIAAGPGMYFKIPDLGYQNPFDGFVLRGVPAYVAVWWEKRRGFSLTQVYDWKFGKSFKMPSEIIDL